MPDQTPKRTVDERIDAIAASVELLTHDVHELQDSTAKLRDAALALLTIAGNHERRFHDSSDSPQ